MKYETGKNPKRQIIGLHNREAGRQFEQLIKNANDLYGDYGIAEIGKTPEPMRPLRPMSGGQFVACFEKKAEPDFKGVLDGGRCICFEAKHTIQGKISQSEVTEQQTKILDRYYALKAECFVIVSFGFFTFHRIPWDVWRSMKKLYGHKYMTPAEADRYKIKFKYGVLDYLGRADIVETKRREMQNESLCIAANERANKSGNTKAAERNR